MKTIYTIKEYADATHTTTAAVYKKLKTSLKPFITVVNGQKCIDTGLFDQEQQRRFETIINQPFETVENPKTSTETSTKSSTEYTGNVMHDNTGTVASYVALLEQQIAQKDNQINQLQQTNAELSKTISELTKIADQAQQLQAHSQKLLENPNRKGVFDGFKTWWNSTADINTEK